MNRRAGTGLSGHGGRKGKERAIKKSWRRGEDGEGSFQDEAGKVEHEGERISHQGRFRTVGQAEPWGTFQVAAGLGSIAAFGITLSANAQLPGIRANLHVAGQADGAIREGQTGGERSAEWMSGVREWAGGPGGLLIGGQRNIRLGLVDALLVADPLGGSVLVVMAVAG